MSPGLSDGVDEGAEVALPCDLPGEDRKEKLGGPSELGFARNVGEKIGGTLTLHLKDARKSVQVVDRFFRRTRTITKPPEVSVDSADPD